jgi:hypothetical protein
MSVKSIRSSLAVSLIIVISLSTACADKSTPTAPSNPAPPQAAAPPPAPAPATASVQLTINPNPVPFSGQPITDSPGCAGSKNTWFYEQVAKETGGVAVTFTSRIDKFDGRVVNTVSNLNMVVPANGTLSVKSRWCSSQAVAHTAQTTFSGIDDKGHTLTVEAPVANLKSP